MINYDSYDDSDSIRGEKIIISIGAIIVAIVLFFRFGLPALQKSGPEASAINVPDKIEVGINK